MSVLRLQSEHHDLVNKDELKSLRLHVPFYSPNYLLRSTVSAFFLGILLFRPSRKCTYDIPLRPGILFTLTLSSLYILR